METTGENTNHNVPLSEQLKAVQTELMETKGQLAEARQEIVTLQAKLAQQDSVPRVDKVVSPQEETANSGLQDGESKATPASEREPGALLGSFSEVSFLAPRGKFDVCFHEAAITLKGKSSDVVVTYSRLQRLWELPDPATKGTLTVCQLSPPVENGKQSVSFLVLLSKPSDKQPMPKIRLTTDQEPAVVKGSAASVLSTTLRALSPPLEVTGVGKFVNGAGEPAVQCYNKASEARLYLLHNEMLLREAGKVQVFPYTEIRIEILPPSGRRTFDMALESTVAKDAKGGPVKMEFSMIAAEEFERVRLALTKSAANVNGSKDGADGKAPTGESSKGKGKARAVPEAAAADNDDDDENDDDDADDDDDDDDDDDSDDEDDDDFCPDEEEEPEEEFDEQGGDPIEGMEDVGGGDVSDGESESDDERRGDESGDESSGGGASPSPSSAGPSSSAAKRRRV
uniref:FACT complex subunit SSRP1 n=1 Tax=Chrysotila carterae TaxID=13221 RepID=A0A7S4BAX7_CHRCT